LLAILPVSGRSKNIIGTQLIIGRFRFSVSKSKENKAIEITSDIHIEKSIFPSFREAV
jgi:hypothetical protein